VSLWTSVSTIPFQIDYLQAGHPDGIRTRYLQAGDKGDAIVFLHGTGGHLEAFQQNIAAHAQHFRVFAMDFIGHGYSDKPDRPYEIRDYVKHVLDFCNAKGLKRIHLSGESLGGWVAAKFAADYPDRVGKLVLNTAGGLNPEVASSLYELSIQAVTNPTREKTRKRLEWLLHDKSLVTEDLVDARYQIYCQPGFKRAMENILTLQNLKIRKRNLLTDKDLRSIVAPTLVVWTDHDPTGAVTVGQRFASTISNARLVVLKNSGHWPQYEEAELFNKLHMDFLSS